MLASFLHSVLPSVTAAGVAALLMASMDGAWSLLLGRRSDEAYRR